MVFVAASQLCGYSAKAAIDSTEINSMAVIQQDFIKQEEGGIWLGGQFAGLYTRHNEISLCVNSCPENCGGGSGEQT